MIWRIALAGLVVGFCYHVRKCYKCRSKLLMALRTDGVIKLSDIMQFSNRELSWLLFGFCKNHNTFVTVSYYEDEYLLIDKSLTKEEVLEKIQFIQGYISEKLRNDLPLGSYTDRIIARIWVDECDNINYRMLLKKRLNDLSEDGEVSQSTFNEIVRRGYI